MHGQNNAIGVFMNHTRAGILHWLDAKTLRWTSDTLAVTMKATDFLGIMAITESNNHNELRCCYVRDELAKISA